METQPAAKLADPQITTPVQADDAALPLAPLVVFAGGGTGGHLYPALAVAEALRKRFPRVRFTFFGTHRPIDERVLGGEDGASRQPFVTLIRQTLPALQSAPWHWPSIYRGFRASAKLCRERLEADRPAIVIGTGGLGSVPAVREAARMGIPTALLNPDALPGRANRYLARLADIVFVQWEEAVGQFPASIRVAVAGCPVRSAFNEASREDGISRFELDPELKTLVVTGASQGARTVNEAVVANLEFLADAADWQVIHLTGHSDFEDIKASYAQLDSKSSARTRVIAYTDHLAEAMAAADLVVARAGASSLAEITALGRASILMPYPHHRDLHQLANARCLVRASAARIVHDKVESSENGPALRRALEQLMSDEVARETMATAARRLGRGQAASQIADHVAGLPEFRESQSQRAPQPQRMHATH